MVQNTQMKEHSTTHKQNQEQNHMIISIDAEKFFDNVNVQS
jgi:hypothetical protein